MSKKALKETIERITKLKEDISKRLDRMVYLETVHEDNYSNMMLHIRLNIKKQKQNALYLNTLKSIVYEFEKIHDGIAKDTLCDLSLSDLRNAISLARKIVEESKQ